MNSSFLYVEIPMTYYFVKVSMLLESGKSMLKELSNEFEEKMILYVDEITLLLKY